MNAELSESIQHAVNPGNLEDDFYPGQSNCKVQAFPSTMENRFYVNLPSNNQNSSSTVIFSPDEGISDVVLTLQLPTPTTSITYTNWALNAGWGYAMIDTVGLRIGGSSLYYWTGDQLLIENLAECESSYKRDQILQLGGGQILNNSSGTNTFATAANLSAQVYLKLPFNSVSSLQKPLPLCSDNLTQPIQIIIKFKNFTDVFFATQSTSATSVLPTSWATAAVNFRQVHLQDSAHLLSRRYNMNSHALAWPLRNFSQTTFRTSISTDGSSAQAINLTGFRSGSVKGIRIWITPSSSTGATVSNFNGGSGNNFNFISPVACTLSVNGLVYYQSTNYNSLLWGMIDTKNGAGVSNTVLNQLATPGAYAQSTSVFSSFVYIPLAQETQPMAGENELSLGLPIQNAVVNLSLTMPTTSAAVSYTVSAEYLYACTLMFSKGTAEYVF